MTKNLLTTEQCNEIAGKQQVTVTDLEILTRLIDFIPSANDEKVKQDPLFYYSRVYNTLDVIYDKLQYIINDLGNTTGILYNTDDKDELEAMGVVIDGSDQTE